MQKVKIFIASLLAMLVLITACKDDFLEVAPTGSLSSVELSTLPGLEGSLIAAYSILLGRGGGQDGNGNNIFADGFYADASNWFWGSVLGGEANKGTNAGDQGQVNEIQIYAAQTTNASVFQKYAASYEGVSRCNATLRLIGVAEADGIVSSADLTRISAEARFLRGHFYFELKKNFNNTPYVDETWDEVSTVSNDQDLWPFIEADFQFAFDNLPETQGDAGRANKWAAAAYLGKAFLYQGKWAEAKVMFDDVITKGVTANGQTYGLNDNYAEAFRSTNDNSLESVFASQAAAGTGSVQNANPTFVLNFPNGDTGPGCCGFFQPSIELGNSFRTDANGLPLLDNSYNDPGNEVVQDQGIASGDAFTPDAGNLDPRIDHSIGRRGIPYLDWGIHPGQSWIRDQPYAGPYSPKKFIYYLSGNGVENDLSSWTPGYTAVNYNIIRYADVLLMAAEAEIELNNLDAGLGLINQVRERAKNSPLLDANGDPAANYVIEPYGSFASQDQARTAVRFERKLELSGEGHRKYDLVRWGIAEDVLNAYLTYERPFLNDPYGGAIFTSNNDEYLPIPQSEIDLQGADVLIQNPGY
ncbi:MAG: RagB/SusD family nutrient uptake outer membrane protein [Bacteroidota bacterium]